MAAVHGPAIVRAIDRFAGGRAGPCLIHGFGSWIGVAAAATRRLERRGISCALIATAWSTYAHETRGKLRGANGAHGPRNKLALRWELI